MLETDDQPPVGYTTDEQGYAYVGFVEISSSGGRRFGAAAAFIPQAGAAATAPEATAG